MTDNRAKSLLYECVDYIVETSDCYKMMLESIGFTEEELKELGYEWMLEGD